MLRQAFQDHAPATCWISLSLRSEPDPAGFDRIVRPGPPVSNRSASAFPVSVRAGCRPRSTRAVRPSVPSGAEDSLSRFGYRVRCRSLLTQRYYPLRLVSNLQENIGDAKSFSIPIGRAIAWLCRFHRDCRLGRTSFGRGHAPGRAARAAETRVRVALANRPSAISADQLASLHAKRAPGHMRAGPRMMMACARTDVPSVNTDDPSWILRKRGSAIHCA